MKKMIIMAVAIMLLAACKKEMASDSSNQVITKRDQSNVNQQNGKVKKTFTIQGSLSGTSTLVPSISCGKGSFLNVGHGTGNSSHFGFFTFDNADCLGAMHHTVFTYPNGDKAYTTEIAESIDPVSGLLVQDAIFSGGTGRFADVTGSTRLFITKFEPTNTPGVYAVAGYFEGTITITKFNLDQ